MGTGPDYLGTAVCAAAALLLAWAALGRLSGSGFASRRAAGALELIVALAVLLAPGRPAAVLAALTFTAFTAIHLRDRVRGDGQCECFGQEHVDPTRGALLTLLTALLCAGAAALGAPSLRELAGGDPVSLAWVPTVAIAAALAWRAAFSGVGALARISDVSGALLAGVGPGTTAGAGVAGIERRSFLLRAAVVGSALAAAPVRFLLYPGTALGAVVHPSQCAGGKCTDGYTAFCCEITQGNTNTCPTGTFAGGWWMCTDYQGRQLCAESGVRFYVDCNALPGQTFPGGCRCANGDCDNFKVACNIFRYGQCNTQIEGTTAVVCRMITCENPSTISELHCSAALAIDDATCVHEAGCLEPPALQLAGAGGA